jgi:phosphatidylglycerophosphate synthase
MRTQAGIGTAKGTAPMDRRPISLRDLVWVRAFAAWLVRKGVKPNHISILGMGCAALSAACLFVVPAAEPAGRSILFVAAAAFIPLRGLSNLCDGLMAIEGGLRTPSGEIFNDLPDRVSDTLVLVAAGYAVPGAIWTHELAWFTALLAALTAYVRVLGAAAGAAHQFGGPMAKTQRMVVMGLACLVAAAQSAAGAPPSGVVGGLAVVAAGSAITIARRTARVIRELDAR